MGDHTPSDCADGAPRDCGGHRGVPTEPPRPSPTIGAVDAWCIGGDEHPGRAGIQRPPSPAPPPRSYNGHRTLGRALSGFGIAAIGCGGYLGGHLAYSRGVGVNTTAFQSGPTEWTPLCAVDDLGDGGFVPRSARHGRVRCHSACPRFRRARGPVQPPGRTAQRREGRRWLHRVSVARLPLRHRHGNGTVGAGLGSPAGLRNTRPKRQVRDPTS